jgi:hypothetical protein
MNLVGKTLQTIRADPVLRVRYNLDEIFSPMLGNMDVYWHISDKIKIRLDPIHFIRLGVSDNV